MFVVEQQLYQDEGLDVAMEILEWIWLHVLSCLRNQWVSGPFLKRNLIFLRQQISRLRIKSKLSTWEKVLQWPRPNHQPIRMLILLLFTTLEPSATMLLDGWRKIRTLLMIPL